MGLQTFKEMQQRIKDHLPTTKADLLKAIVSGQYQQKTTGRGVVEFKEFVFSLKPQSWIYGKDWDGNDLLHYYLGEYLQLYIDANLIKEGYCSYTKSINIINNSNKCFYVLSPGHYGFTEAKDVLIKNNLLRGRLT